MSRYQRIKLKDHNVWLYYIKEVHYIHLKFTMRKKYDSFVYLLEVKTDFFLLILFEVKMCPLIKCFKKHGMNKALLKGRGFFNLAVHH